MRLHCELFIFKGCFISFVHFPDKSLQYFASSGTLSMNPDGSCQILAEEAVRLEDIDLAVWFYRYRFNLPAFDF